MRRISNDSKIELQMTPMIDIIFQLLVFFIMSFRIALPEGDFNVGMPTATASPTTLPNETPTLLLRLRSDDSGNLSAIELGDRSLPIKEDSFRELQAQIRSLINDSGGPGVAGEQEVEIEADYNLRYEYAMKAITALSGYTENGRRYQLVDKIRFAPAKEK